MSSLRRKFIDNITRFADIFVMLTTFLFSIYVFASNNVASSLLGFLSYKFSLMNLLAGLVMVVVWLYIFEKFGLYQPRRLASLTKEWVQVAQAVTIGVMLIGSVGLFFNRQHLTQDMLVTFWLMALVFTILVRTILREFLILLRNSGRNLRYVLFIGSNKRAIELAQKLMSQPELGYRLLGFVDDEKKTDYSIPQANRVGNLKNLPAFLDKTIVDEVYIVLPIDRYYSKIRSIINLCQELGIVCRVPSDWLNISTANTAAFDVHGESILTVYSGSPYQSEYLWLKRMLDVIFAFILIILLLPLGLLITLGVRLSSSGPVFFRQKRIGYNRRPFDMIKFRTMVDGAENMQETISHLNEMDGPVFKINQDPRITRIGKWLRRTSLRRRRSSSGMRLAVSPLPAFLRRRFSMYHSRKKPTPNTPPTAICVELTGNPSQLAMITVIAALSATQ